jgi:hypothetical protein
MSAQLESRRGLLAAAVLLGLGALACTTTPGMVSAPEVDRKAPTAKVEGVVHLTNDYSSENVPVLMIWTEVEDPSGVDAAKQAVPVADGELPRGAEVRVARTDVVGKFVHPSTVSGGLTLRIGSLPEQCRRPADRIVSLGKGDIARVQIDVICSRPKPAPPQ